MTRRKHGLPAPGASTLKARHKRLQAWFRLHGVL